MVAISTLSLKSEIDFSENIKLIAAVKLNVESIKDDSLKYKNPNIPYFERLNIPINFEYRMNNTSSALITFNWIGPRKISLTEKNELVGYGLFSIQLKNKLFTNISLIATGNNLLNNNYQLWQNYPAQGIYFDLGIQIHW